MQSAPVKQLGDNYELGDVALKSLRMSESRYRRLFETARDGILLLNSDTAQIDDVNPYLIELLGYSHAEFLGKKLWEVGAFSDITESKEMFEKLQTVGYVRYQDLPLKTKSGVEIAVEFVSNSYDCEGVKVIQCNIRNISERKADQAKILRHTFLYAALSQCNKAIVNSVTEEELFLKVCRAAVEFGGMKMAWVGISNPETLLVRPTTSFGDHYAYLKAVPISADAESIFGHCPTGTAIRESKPIWCQDFLNDPSTALWRASASTSGFSASASLPLRKEGVVIGAFTLYSSLINSFDDYARNLLIEMAEDISFALDNFQLKFRHQKTAEDVERLHKDAEQQLHNFATHLQNVREQEKTQIAREIHDELGGTMNALKIKIHQLKIELSEDNNEIKINDQVEAMSQMINDAAGVTRNIISDLRPSVLDDFGLLAAIEWQAQQFNKLTGIKYLVNCIGDEGNLDNLHSIAIFRVLQEALTNVTKHSGASKVEIEYHHSEDEVLLTVSDNGRGISDDQETKSGSFGMLGMKERVKQLGGTIRFDIPPGGGLCLMVAFPLTSILKV